MTTLTLRDLGFISEVSNQSLNALKYIAAVEAADGQPLEAEVKSAIINFVDSCYNGGLAGAIKACCILAGARTLNGALIPLVGPAPTNFNFVAGDYNRKTGLAGNGTTKYLNSNRNNNADSQNSHHLAVFVSSANSQESNRGYIGCGLTDVGSSHIFSEPGVRIGVRSRSSSPTGAGSPTATGFIGISRSSSANVSMQINTNSLLTLASESPLNQNIIVFGRNQVAQSNGRLAFYSIGQSIDLTILKAHVTTLINAFAAAIP